LIRIISILEKNYEDVKEVKKEGFIDI